jgi:hypothetical protein
MRDLLFLDTNAKKEVGWVQKIRRQRKKVNSIKKMRHTSGIAVKA